MYGISLEQMPILFLAVMGLGVLALRYFHGVAQYRKMISWKREYYGKDNPKRY